MKLNYKFLLMTLLTLCMMGAYSCGGGDDIPEPEPEPIPDPDKVILNTQSLTFEATESSSTLTISANKAWTATSNQTWCTLSKESGIGGSETITINVAANPNETERTATITVKAGTASATATVKQAKKEAEETDKVELDKTSFEVGSDNGSTTLKITANKDWTAESSASWCKVSAASGKAGTTELTVTYEANPNESERTATITVKAGTASATATVKQAKKEVEEADKVELDKTSFEVGADNGNVTLKITANKDWTAESSASWCKVSAASGKAGTTELTVTYEANPNETERTATITVKAGTASATATVKQAKKETQQGGGDSDESGTNGGSIEDMENKKW